MSSLLFLNKFDTSAYQRIPTDGGMIRESNTSSEQRKEGKEHSLISIVLYVLLMFYGMTGHAAEYFTIGNNSYVAIAQNSVSLGLCECGDR